MVKEVTLSPQEVREILQSDNKEIIRLCKIASIIPKLNSKGYTYFSYNEVQKLKKLREKYQNAVLNSTQCKTLEKIKNAFYQLEDFLPENSIEYMNNQFKTLEEFFEEYEKCKSENNIMRTKLSKISKENCFLKDKINEFKPLGLGVYIKKHKKDYSI